MTETDIAIDSNGVALAGTLCTVATSGRVPAVLLIHGTGPLDRDENMERQRLDVFNTIAGHLAEQGVASLRYDKRGCGKSGGDYYRAGHSDLVADAVNCFDALANLDICDPQRMFVLGHSEGCVIAPQVSAQRAGVAGLMLLCPFVDRIDSILIKQATQIEREFNALTGLGGAARRWLARLMGIGIAGQQRLIRKLKSSRADTLRSGLQKVPAKAFRELIELDPRAIMASVTCPMLVIGGAKDLQCDPADVQRIADLAVGAVSAHVIPNLTHVLRFDTGPPSFLGAAELLSKPMEPIVLDLIGRWLADQRIAS